MDIAKGIAILLVILGHCDFEGESWILNTFIYAFHMPIFFMIAGMLEKIKTNLDKNSCISKKILKYVKYYYMIGIFNLFVEISKDLIQREFSFIYLKDEIIKLIFFVSNQGGLWFLISLTVTEIIFYYVKKSKNNTINLLISFIGGILCFICSIYSFENLLVKTVIRTIISHMFFYIGYVLFDKINNINNSNKNHIIYTVLVAFFVISTIYNKEVNLLRLRFNNPILYIINAVLGSIIVIILSKAISEKKNVIVDNMILYGINSIIIYGTLGAFIAVVRQVLAIFIKNNYIRNLIIFLLVLSIETIIIKVIINLKNRRTNK